MTKKKLHKSRIVDNNFETSSNDAQYNGMKLMLMTAMSEMGISAEEYDSFLKSDIDKKKIKDDMLRMSRDSFIDDDEIIDETFGLRPVIDEVSSIADADKKSLRIKVQMKDVSKPPMWRELVIPADFNFSQLHYAIQAATSLENCHLWQFQHQAYRPDLQIGIPSDGEEFGITDWTHDADKTPVTGFLAQKGDKLEYVYDFGDDWIFTVSVLEVMEREGDVAVCIKWKSELQPMEDIGGIYAYLRLRDILSSIDSLTKKEKTEIADSFGFDDFKSFAGWLDDSIIDIEHINERLAEIPGHFEPIL